MQTDRWNGVDLPVYDRHNGTVTKHFVRVLDRVDQLLPRCKPAFTLLFVSLACVWTFSFFLWFFRPLPFRILRDKVWTFGLPLSDPFFVLSPLLLTSPFLCPVGLFFSFSCLFLFLFLATAGRERPCSQMKRWQGTVSNFVFHSRELCQWGAWHRNDYVVGFLDFSLRQRKIIAARFLGLCFMAMWSFTDMSTYASAVICLCYFMSSHFIGMAGKLF